MDEVEKALHCLHLVVSPAVAADVRQKVMAKIEKLCHEIDRLRAENERLLRGDFSEAEFQRLCHNFSDDDATRFRAGCEEYQRKLFG